MLRFPLMLSRTQDAPAVWKQLIRKKLNFPKKQPPDQDLSFSSFILGRKLSLPILHHIRGIFYSSDFYHILNFLLMKQVFSTQTEINKGITGCAVTRLTDGKVTCPRAVLAAQGVLWESVFPQDWSMGSHNSTAHHPRNTGILTGMQPGQHTCWLCDMTQARKSETRKIGWGRNFLDDPCS